MSTKLPLEVQKASWTASSSTSTTTNLTNTVSLKAYQTYLIVVNIPVTTISSETYGQFKLYLSNGSIVPRLIHKTRGIGTWIYTPTSNVTAAIRKYTTTSYSFTEVSNAGLYAITLNNNNASDSSKRGVLLPLDVQTNTWKATSSSAANTQLTNSITLQKDRTYLVIVNAPSFNSTPQPIALYNTISSYGYRNLPTYGTAMWIITPSADMTTYAITGYSASTNYTNTSYSGIYAIKIA